MFLGGHAWGHFKNAEPEEEGLAICANEMLTDSQAGQGEQVEGSSPHFPQGYPEHPGLKWKRK